MPRNIYSHILFGNEVEDLSAGSRPSAPTVYTGRKLRGSLFIISHDLHDHPFDAVQITLKGAVKTRVQVTDSAARKTEKSLIHMSYVKLASDFRRSHCTGLFTIGHETDFFFNLPESVMFPSDEACVPRKLPPSIRISKSHPSTVTGNCDVSYFVEAQILKGDKLVCYSRREILVFPAAEIPPPVDPTCFRNEFRMSAVSSLGSFWNPTKSTTIVVSSVEPRPVVFPMVKGEYGSTEVQLDFRAIGSPHSGDGTPGPRLTDCDVVITIEAVTYFLENEIQSMMSIQEAAQSLSTVVKKTAFKTERRHLLLGKWEKCGDTAAHAAEQPVEWETSASVPVILPANFSRLPSFSSALLVRRYAISIQIIVGTKYISSGKRMKLRIPVQIVHAPTRRTTTARHEAELEYLDAPPYV